MATNIYNHKWQHVRSRWLRRKSCEFCLPRIEQATIVDHIKPHGLKQALADGDPVKIAAARKLFWDRNNWQPLCKPCHDSKKQRIEKSGYIAGCDESGMPLDPNHHWRKRH